MRKEKYEMLSKYFQMLPIYNMPRRLFVMYSDILTLFDYYTITIRRTLRTGKTPAAFGTFFSHCAVASV